MRPIIPPRKDAKIEQHGNRKAEPLPRDETIRTIRKRGRRTWKKTSGYHRRSIGNPDQPLQTDTRRHLARPNPNQPTDRNTGGKTVKSPRKLECRCTKAMPLLKAAKFMSEG